MNKIRRCETITIDYPSWNDTEVSQIVDKNKKIFEATINFHNLIELSKKYDLKVTNSIIREIESHSSSFDPTLFCNIFYYFDDCGDCVIKNIVFRRIWFVVLCIDNVGTKPISLKGYTGTVFHPFRRFDYRDWNKTDGEYTNCPLPNLCLNPEQSLLIPEFIMLAPINDYLFRNSIADIIEYDIPFNEYQEENREYHDLDNYLLSQEICQVREQCKFNLIGPSFKVEKCILQGESISIHEFNPDQLVTFNSSIQMGSCPHLICYSEGKQYYGGELLINGRDLITIQACEYIIIAEVEDEQTIIDEIHLVKGKSRQKIIERVILNKGEFLIIKNESKHEFIEVTGRYILDQYVKKMHDKNKYKLQLINTTLKEIDVYLNSINTTDIEIIKKINMREHSK